MPLSAATRKATLFRETSPSETLTGVRFCAAPGAESGVRPGPIAVHAEQASTMASHNQTLSRARRKRELRMLSVPSSCDADLVLEIPGGRRVPTARGPRHRVVRLSVHDPTS